MDINSKIYIAGHHGLVGSAILKSLQYKGYHNFILRTHSELDLTSQQAVESFFATEKPDYVFLAAAKVGGIMANSKYRGEFIYHNLMIQNNVIHNAWKYGVKKLLFLGSTCIYPREAPQPMAEDCLLSSPLEYTNEPYAIAKIAGIKMCESYNLQYGTNFLSVMPTNLYGPNDNFHLQNSHVLPALIRRIYLGRCLEESNWDAIRNDLNKRPIDEIDGNSTEEEIREILNYHGVFDITAANGETSTFIQIWGTGEPMREFLWSEDMADACVYVIENLNFTDMYNPGQKEIRNTHLNIGTGKSISIRELANLIKEVIGFNGFFRYDTTKPDGTLLKESDVTKLNNLGWQHKVELKEGVERLVKWYLGEGVEEEVAKVIKTT